MKIIDKLLADEIKETIIRVYCPNNFGYKNSFCKCNCKECWNREIEECENN